MNDNKTTDMKKMDEDVDFEQTEYKETPAKGKGGSTGLISLIVLLTLLLGGGAIYWLYDKLQTSQSQVDEKLQQYDGKISGLVSEVKESTSKVSDLNKSQQSNFNEFQNKLEDLSSKETVFAETLESIQNKKPKQETDWIIAEVEYLLTVAQQRLSLERDVPTALAAMEGADNRLRDLGNPNLNGVREQLIKEMNALRNVEDADISGMVLTISDFTSGVEALPLKDFEVPTLKDMKIPSKEEAAKGSWKDVGLSMWGDLVKLVEIKDQKVPDEILFDPEKRFFLYQNLQLELTSAKLSILRRDSVSMKASLSRVTKLLNRFFDTKSARVKNMLEKVHKMENTDLQPPMPEVTQALNMLKEYKHTSASQQEQSL